MPSRANALKAATKLSGRFSQMQEQVETHVSRKHKDLQALTGWLHDNAAQAQQHLQGYGLLSFFTAQVWVDIYNLIEDTLLNPTSIHPGVVPNRALFYRQFPHQIGTFMSQQQIAGGAAPPPGIAANFQVDGLIVVVDCNTYDLITCFPSPAPGTAQLV
jgi:hypothetical protein